MSADLAVLRDRAVIVVEGPDARALLQRLVTNDVAGLQPGEARYAALLTPQGKITTDFLVVAGPDEAVLYLDGPKATAAGLVRALGLYRLRAKVTIVDRSDQLEVVAFQGAAPAPAVLTYPDPRSAALWSRALVPTGSVAPDEGAIRRQEETRIRAGVPEGGVDFAYGDAFPHEANLDHLGGVDFTKGCYVGQEVVSRVHHRGTARKRIVLAVFEGAPPSPGVDVMADGLVIGSMGSSTDGLGLALVRLDRVAEAQGPVTAAGIPLRLQLPDRR